MHTHNTNRVSGFTLIEIIIVLSIVSLLMTVVGPLAINNLEKARAKQEMLTVKTWLRKISYRSYNTGNNYLLKLSGKKLELFLDSEIDEIQSTKVTSKALDYLFFQPQVLYYNSKGFVTPERVVGSYQEKALEIDLSEWVNHEQAPQESKHE